MTHNRHQLLDNLILPHFTQMGVSLVVVDSSAEPHEASQNDPRVDYVHCPNEPLPYKLVKPVNELVKTPYMLMHPDDRLTSKDGIVKCVEFLENNSDYTTAHGLTFEAHYGNESRMTASSLDRMTMQVDSDRPEERPLQGFVQFITTWYAVHPTECWRQILQRMNPKIVNLYLCETFGVMLSMIHGKSVQLPIFYSVSMGGPSIHEGDKRYFNSPYKLALDPRYAEEVEVAKVALTEYLMECSTLGKEVARRYVEAGLALYWLRDREPHEFSKTLKDRIAKEWRSLMNKTILKAKEKKRKAAKRSLQVIKEKDNLDKALELIGDESRKEFDELMTLLRKKAIF